MSIPVSDDFWTPILAGLIVFVYMAGLYALARSGALLVVMLISFIFPIFHVCVFMIGIALVFGQYPLPKDDPKVRKLLEKKVL